MTDELAEFDPNLLGREGLTAVPGGDTQSHDGTGRVDLGFTIEDLEAPATHRKVRVPPGVTVFDSASWNGIAIDSTCGGHGTCHKCKVRLTPATPATKHDVKTFSREQLDERLAAGLPGPGDPRPRGRRTAAHHPSQGRHRRRRAAGDPAPGRAEALRRAERAHARATSAPTSTGCWPRSTTSSRWPTCTCCGGSPTVLRAADFKVTAVVVDEALIDVEPGDTTAVRYAIAFDLGTTTVVATLLDLVTGTPVAVASMLNRQQPFGGDVISRISATMLDPDRARPAAGRRRARRSRALADAGLPRGRRSTPRTSTRRRSPATRR